MIIGLCGQAGTGKDTVADIMVKNHGFVKVSLADPLKRICRDVFAFSDEQLWGPSEKRNEVDERYCRGVIRVRPRQVLEEPEAPPAETRQYLTPRYALQQLGTQWGRDCYPNIWIDYCLRMARRLEEGGYAYDAQRGLFPVSSTKYMWPNTHVVIPDVRFKNEVDAIHAAGGQVVRITRPGAGLTGAAAQHASETEQSTIPEEAFDAQLPNNRGLKDLPIIVRILLEALAAQ